MMRGIQITTIVSIMFGNLNNDLLNITSGIFIPLIITKMLFTVNEQRGNRMTDLFRMESCSNE